MTDIDIAGALCLVGALFVSVTLASLENMTRRRCVLLVVSAWAIVTTCAWVVYTTAHTTDEARDRGE